MASYAMAHFKLDMKLKETGYNGGENTRLRVYLTNSLEESVDTISDLPFAQWLSNEANEANSIKKDVPVTNGVKTHDDGNLINFLPFPANNQRYGYRPFDIRYINYDLKKVKHPRYEVVKHFLQGENIGLAAAR